MRPGSLNFQVGFWDGSDASGTCERKRRRVQAFPRHTTPRGRLCGPLACLGRPMDTAIDSPPLSSLAMAPISRHRVGRCRSRPGLHRSLSHPPALGRRLLRAGGTRQPLIVQSLTCADTDAQAHRTLSPVLWPYRDLSNSQYPVLDLASCSGRPGRAQNCPQTGPKTARFVSR